MDKFLNATVKILAVIQWGFLLLIVPCISISSFMQETGWDPEWAPAFLGRDGGGITGCGLILIGALIVWAVKESIYNTYVLPRLVDRIRKGRR